jgi:chromo domain-containing protein 1
MCIFPGVLYQKSLIGWLIQQMKNHKYANGWVEGFDDTEPKIRKAAETLWQKNLVAIAHLNNERGEVLLAYPPRSPDFSFLDAAPKPEQGYLNLALRSALGPMDRLSSSARSSRSHLTEMDKTTKSNPNEQPKVSRKIGVKPLRNFDAAQENVGQSPSASPSFDTQDTGVPTPSLVQSKPGARISSRTNNSTVQDTSHFSHESKDIDNWATQPSTPPPAGARSDAAIDLDEIFRRDFGITFETLATLSSMEKAQRVEMFYLWFPEESESVRNERDLIESFLKKHTTLLYSNRYEMDWERFVTICKKNSMQGVVLVCFLHYFTSHPTNI